MTNDDHIFDGVRGTLFLLKYILLHEKSYTRKVLSRLAIYVGIAVAFLAVDFAKLTPSGILKPTTQFIVRISCLLMLLLLYVLSLIPATKTYLNKWRNPSKLTSKDLERFIRNI